MAWLILRVYDDRQGRNLVQIAKMPAKLGSPSLADIEELATVCKIEVSDGPATRKGWPWSVIAYTSRSKDGIGRSGGMPMRLPARPRNL